MYINSYCFADFLVFPSYLLIICPGVAWLFPVTSSVCLSLSSDLSIPSSLLCSCKFFYSVYIMKSVYFSFAFIM